MPGCRVNVATVLLLSSRFRGHSFQAEFGGVGGRSSRLRVARHRGVCCFSNLYDGGAADGEHFGVEEVEEADAAGLSIIMRR